MTLTDASRTIFVPEAFFCTKQMEIIKNLAIIPRQYYSGLPDRSVRAIAKWNQLANGVCAIHLPAKQIL